MVSPLVFSGSLLMGKKNPNTKDTKYTKGEKKQ
jgi:hypothetical protein